VKTKDRQNETRLYVKLAPIS